MRTAKGLVKDIGTGETRGTKELDSALTGVTDPDVYINICTHYLRLKDTNKQDILDDTSLVRRLILFEHCLNT